MAENQEAKYKGANGKFLTESLFYETNRSRETNPPAFTLKSHEHEGFPSLKLLYLGYRDPTEYTFAMGVFGSYQHWMLLCGLSWFKPHIEEWRAELDVMLRAEAVEAARSILSDKDTPAANRMQAARFMANKEWAEKPTKGRPSKKQVSQEARRLAESSRELEEDYNRVLN